MGEGGITNDVKAVLQMTLRRYYGRCEDGISNDVKVVGGRCYERAGFEAYINPSDLLSASTAIRSQTPRKGLPGHHFWPYQSSVLFDGRWWRWTHKAQRRWADMFFWP